MSNPPVFDQDAFRGRDDDVALNSGTFNGGGGLNGNWTQDTGVNFRIRFVIQETSGNKSNNENFQLWARVNTGTWFQVTATSGTSGAALFNDTQGIADDATTTQVIGSGTYTTGDSDGYCDGTSDNDTGFVDHDGNDEAELEFCLQLDSAGVNDTDTVDFRVRDSAGAELSSYTNEPTVTANVPPPASYTQANFRIRDNDNETLNSTTFSHALNANATIDLETRFRIRFEIENAGGSDSTTYKLQYNLNAGGWNDVNTTPLDWTTRTAVNRVEAVDSKQYADADATTDILSGSTETFTAGEGVEEDNATGTISLGGQHTEIEFCILLHRFGDGPVVLADGDTIDFRVVEGDGTALATYTNTPTITVNEPAGLIGGCYVETPNRIGPFVDANGNHYVIIEPTETDPKFMIMKSIDSGDSWEEMNGAGRPTNTDLEGIDAKIETDVLHIAHHAGGTVYYHRFNLSNHASPDQWAETDTSVVTTTDEIQQQVALALLSNGDLRVFFTYDPTNYKIGMRSRISGTWDTATTDIWDSNQPSGVMGVMGASDRFYVFAHLETTGDLVGKSVSSAAALEDLFHASTTAANDGTSVDTTTGTSNEDRSNIIAPTYWNDGSDKVLVGFVDDTDGNLYTRVITVGSGGSVGARGAAVNDADVIAEDNGGSRQPVADIVRDPSSGDFHAFFATETTGGGLSDLLHDVSTDDGSTWGTDETVTVRSPKSRINWVRVIVDSGTAGIFYDDASGTEQNNSSTGGDNTSGVGGLATGFIWYDPYTTSAGTTHNLSAVMAGASTTPDTASLAVARDFTASTDGASATNDTVSLAVARDMTASLDGASVTPDVVELRVTLNFTASLDAVSVTPDTASIAVARNFTASLDGTSVTPDTASLAVARAFTASVDGVSVTPDTAALSLAIQLLASMDGASVTPDTAQLRVTLNLVASADGVSVTPDTVSLAVARAMIATLDGVSVTSDTVSLAVARDMVASLDGASVTPDTVALAIARDMAAAMDGASVTPDTVSLAVARALTASLDGVSVTPDTASIAVARDMTASLDGASVTPDTVVLTISGEVTLVASMDGVSVTPDTVALAVARDMAASLDGASITPDTVVLTVGGEITLSAVLAGASTTSDTVSLAVARAFTASLDGASVTPDTVSLAVARAFAASLDGASVTPDTVILSLAGEVVLIASMDGVSVTPDTSQIAVARDMTAALEGASTTPDTTTLSLAIPMSAALNGASVTPDTVVLSNLLAVAASMAASSTTPDTTTLAIARSMTATMLGQSNSPDTVSLALTLLFAAVLAGQSATPDNATLYILGETRRGLFKGMGRGTLKGMK